MMRVAILVALALLASAAPAQAANPPSDTLRLLNAARADRHLTALKADRRLAQAAQRHSLDMVARGYFDHVTPTGQGLRSRVAQTGWLRGRFPWELAENLAWGTGELATPEAVVAAWLRSPPHRRIMLDRTLRLVGVGIAAGTPSGLAGATYTADFGA
jgi:uncharacterized protein YkwD